MNPNNLTQLADSLSEILETPVSEEILKLITEPQRNLLSVCINKWKKGEDVTATMLSVLNYGKSKLPKKEHSDKTKFYLENKLK